MGCRYDRYTNKKYQIRDSTVEILKKLIIHHIGYNNTIISDGWESYNWLREAGYNHIIHLHGSNDFGQGSESTSHRLGTIEKYY